MKHMVCLFAFVALTLGLASTGGCITSEKLIFVHVCEPDAGPWDFYCGCEPCPDGGMGGQGGSGGAGGSGPGTGGGGGYPFACMPDDATCSGAPCNDACPTACRSCCALDGSGVLALECPHQ